MTVLHRNSQRRLTRGAFALSIVLGSIGGATGLDSASAHTRAGCSMGNACAWGDAAFSTSGSTSARKDFTWWDGDFHNENYVGTSTNAGDSATSIWNAGTSQQAEFFLDAGCNGSHVDLLVDGSGVSTLGAVFNNEISSGAFSGAVSSC